MGSEIGATFEVYVRVWIGQHHVVDESISPHLDPDAWLAKVEPMFTPIGDGGTYIGHATLSYHAPTPTTARPQIVMGFRSSSRQELQQELQKIPARIEPLWNDFPDPTAACEEGLRVAYVFVQTAPADFDSRLRAQFGDDGRLHFVGLINEGAYQAFVALALSDDEEAADLVDDKFSAAGAMGCEIGYGGAYGPLVLRRQ